MHTIRLRGPWQVEAVARFVPQSDGPLLSVADDLPPAGRMTMPADWSAVFGDDFLGRVRCSRTFNKPTGLDAGERVFLVVEPARSRADVEINGQRLGEVCWGGAAGRFEITALLESCNRLEITVEHPVLDAQISPNDDDVTNSPGGLVGEVRLEIEERG